MGKKKDTRVIKLPNEILCIITEYLDYYSKYIYININDKKLVFDIEWAKLFSYGNTNLDKYHPVKNDNKNIYCYNNDNRDQYCIIKDLYYTDKFITNYNTKIEKNKFINFLIQNSIHSLDDTKIEKIVRISPMPIRDIIIDELSSDIHNDNNENTKDMPSIIEKDKLPIRLFKLMNVLLGYLSSKSMSLLLNKYDMSEFFYKFTTTKDILKLQNIIDEDKFILLIIKNSCLNQSLQLKIIVENYILNIDNDIKPIIKLIYNTDTSTYGHRYSRRSYNKYIYNEETVRGFIYNRLLKTP